MTITIKIILAFKYYLLCHLATILTFVIAGAIGYVIGLHDELFRNQLRTLDRDSKGVYRGIKTLYDLFSVRLANRTVGEAFNRTVAKYPDKVCFYFANQKWTFKELHELTNKVGNYFSAQGFKNGDSVGIFMENCPQYAATWLGLSKIGVVPALINTNLRNEPLRHCLDIVNCKAVIYSEDLSDAVDDLIKAGHLTVPVFSYSKSTDVKIASATNLPTELTNVSKAEPVPSKKVNLMDNLLYIYTSGTTGLPKAATIKHSRFFMLTIGAFRLQNLKHEDIFYTCLPLYHIAGGHVWKDYQGYVGSKANDQKIARNVFKMGDIAFRSGDILVMDEKGYFYFKDRCGDTFRWKGENVSTTEVEEAIGVVTKQKECTVYGVQIPGTEGRAGMAAIVDENDHVDLYALANGLEKKLPPYARPVFVRIVKQIETTGTYKLKKLELQKEGFDITSINDKVYFYHKGKYVLLEKGLYSQIMNGQIRL
ncbi:unnamed protein product [Allacma fusca]|uniref:long-chain-fatty-acid--CoA ligase n=1 Tax=Allacma fusca TaxID=39272 RepID=A0A8J2J9B7_9HEXA|nr:unnamed protein product [Allacma fusca]